MPNFSVAPGGFGAGASATNATFYLAVFEEYATGEVSCRPNYKFRLHIHSHPFASRISSIVLASSFIFPLFPAFQKHILIYFCSCSGAGRPRKPNQLYRQPRHLQRNDDLPLINLSTSSIFLMYRTHGRVDM
jgi:hypothetical protein